MDAFPEFMKHPANRIAPSHQATPGVEGFVFDGANGSQMAFWTCGETATSAEHVHDYDEYMVVVQGCYTLVIHGERIAVKAGVTGRIFYPSPFEPNFRQCSQIPLGFRAGQVRVTDYVRDRIHACIGR